MTHSRYDVRATLGWTLAGTDTFAQALGRLADADLDAASKLPGWSRRHLVGHLARNAEALSRLLSWAQTRVETPMYADSSQRADDIASSATHSPSQLRREFVTTARAWQEQAAGLSDTDWAVSVRSARGREIPAAEVPWMRAREVWLHALDLDAGLRVEVLPEDFSELLIDDVIEYLSTAPDCPPLLLRGAGREWQLGSGTAPITGRVSELAAWLTGRSDGQRLQADALPELPGWL